jgi:hypothetical protein
MLGFLVNEKEAKELEYVLKREMEEILFDIGDDRMEHVVKRAMEERYQILFCLFKRIASPMECGKYVWKKTKRKEKK